MSLSLSTGTSQSNSAAPQPPSPTASASVQVVVRLRPLNEKEKKHGTLPVVSASTADKSVTVIKGHGARQAKTSFNFDNVFTSFSSQQDVFEATLQPVIRDVLMGFESTVFAYGQTGTGKTHTMEGDLSDPDLHGVIPRSAASIFKSLQQSNYIEHTVSCSFLEIYNEELCDLLAEPSAGKPRAKLGIMEGKNGPFCRGLSESVVTSAEGVFALMRKAQQERQVGETNMNKQSSRSHCIFTLRIQAKRKVADGSLLEVSGKLHCVDLAGSECAKSADLEKGNSDQVARERERMNINRSLLTLGRVVTMLREQSSGKKRSVRIPYRDSKLTRILQESLGGRCKTCLIATISPSITAIEESMSTLNYAEAANGIVNKPITTSYMTAQPGTGSFGNDKAAASGGDGAVATVEHWHEMECRLQYMQSQVEEAQQALARKHLQQQELMEKAEKAQAEKEEAVARYEAAEQTNNVLKEEIEQHIQEKDNLNQQLEKSQQALRETTAILRVTQQTEESLTREAQALISVLQGSIQDGDSLHKTLLQLRQEDIERRTATRSFNGSVVAAFQHILQSVNGLDSSIKEFQKTIAGKTESECRRQQQFTDQQQSSINQISNSIEKSIAALKEQVLSGEGINPTVEATASNVRDSLQLLDGMNAEHHRSTSAACAEISGRLTEAAQRFKDLEISYVKSAAEMLETVASNVSASKENLSAMVLSTNDALARAQEERNSSRQTLRAILQDWNATTHESTNNVTGVSSSLMPEIETMLNMLSSETKRHNEIAEKLSEQRAFLQRRKAECSESFGKQNEQLVSQRETFVTSHNRGNELCQTVMANIMGGVQSLLQQHIALISKHHDDTHEEILAGSDELVKMNDGMNKRSVSLLSRVEATNDVLQGHSNAIRQNEDTVSRVFDKTKSGLTDIQSACANLAASSSENEENANNFLTKAEGLEQQAEAAVHETLRQGGEVRGPQLAARLIEDFRSSSNGLTICAKTAFGFARDDVISDTNQRIGDSLRAPEADFSKKMEQQIELTRTGLDCDVAKLDDLSKLHCEELQGMQEMFDRSSEQIGQQLNNERNAISKHAKDILRANDKHVSTSDSLVSQCVKTGSSGMGVVEDYVQDVIHVDEEPECIPDRNNFPYNPELSATPATDEILRDLEAESNLVGNQVGKENDECVALKDTKMEEHTSPLPLLQEQTNIDRSRPEPRLEKSKRRATENRKGIKQSKRVRTLR